MQEIKTHKVNGVNDGLEIAVLDEPGHGNACHRYAIKAESPTAKFAYITIPFQDGTIKEAGVNGVTHETLLAILIHRLEGFQSGPYACQENQVALDALVTAQAALLERTMKRQTRGVEGTHQV